MFTGLDPKEIAVLLERIDSKFITAQDKQLIQELANQILGDYISQDKLFAQYLFFLSLVPQQLPGA